MASEHRTPTVAMGDVFTARVVSEGRDGTPACYLTDGRVCFLSSGIPPAMGQWVKARVTISGATYGQAEVLEIVELDNLPRNTNAPLTLAEKVYIRAKVEKDIAYEQMEKESYSKPVAKKPALIIKHPTQGTAVITVEKGRPSVRMVGDEGPSGPNPGMEPLFGKRTAFVTAVVRGVGGNRHFSVGEEYRDSLKGLKNKDVLVAVKHWPWSFRSYFNAAHSTWSVHVPAAIDHNFERDTGYTFVLTEFKPQAK